MTTRGAGGERGRFIDCQRIGFRILCRIREGRREHVNVERKILVVGAWGLLAALLGARDLRAQGSPENSSRELQIWTGGGHGLNGSTSDTGGWNLGLRDGFILTSPRGPGFLKGQLEYAFDVVPAWVLTQKTNTAYGGGVDRCSLARVVAGRRQGVAG